MAGESSNDVIHVACRDAIDHVPLFYLWHVFQDRDERVVLGDPRKNTCKSRARRCLLAADATFVLGPLVARLRQRLATEATAADGATSWQRRAASRDHAVPAHRGKLIDIFEQTPWPVLMRDSSRLLLVVIRGDLVHHLCQLHLVLMHDVGEARAQHVVLQSRASAASEELVTELVALDGGAVGARLASFRLLSII